MTFLEDILKEVVDGLDEIEINSNVSKKPVFYWGLSDDLPQFIQQFAEGHFPLFWLITGKDKKTDLGYERNCDLIIATREARKELLNTQRINDGYSFKKVLFPLWDSFFVKAKRSGQLNIYEDTLEFTKHPNYSLNDKFEVPEIWDALKVSFRADFYNNNEC